MANLNLINIMDTSFMFGEKGVNLSGNPAKSKVGSNQRNCLIKVPDPHQAFELKEKGIEVMETRPREDQDPDDFVPDYFIRGILSYADKYGNRHKFPPEIYLVNENEEAVPIDEDSVGPIIDDLAARGRVKAVHVILNTSEKKNGNGFNLYIKTMYVEQNIEDDPIASRFKKYRG